MKKFIRIKQSYYVDAIIDVAKDEDMNSIENRVETHIKENGGADSIIVLGGDITVQILKRKPKLSDEDKYECID